MAIDITALYPGVSSSEPSAPLSEWQPTFRRTWASATKWIRLQTVWMIFFFGAIVFGASKVYEGSR